MILYILLSGIPPFWGKTKSRIFDAVRAADLRFPSNPWDFISDSAKELIKGMLCTDTSRRLTAQQVLGRLYILFLMDDYYPVVSKHCFSFSFLYVMLLVLWLSGDCAMNVK